MIGGPWLTQAVSTNTPPGFTNLPQLDGDLHALARNGSGGTDRVNDWPRGFEGGRATGAAAQVARDQEPGQRGRELRF